MRNISTIIRHHQSSRLCVSVSSVLILNPRRKNRTNSSTYFIPPLRGKLCAAELGEDSVPILILAMSQNWDKSVPILIPVRSQKMGHLNKPNFNKQRETPAHKIFIKNDKIQKAINDFTAGNSKMGHSNESLSFRAQRGISETSIIIPSQSEVELFFQENNHPKEEAIKFFNHYKSLHWKLQGRTPILEWKPLVEKWMQNAKKWDSPSGGGVRQPADGGGKERDLQQLYISFLQGHKIFKYISPEHFDQLKLELTEETLQNARSERINQVSGTNQHSLTELWQAYLTSDPNNEVVIKDKPNLIALAKRIAVIKHFHNLKNQST